MRTTPTANSVTNFGPNGLVKYLERVETSAYFSHKLECISELLKKESSESRTGEKSSEFLKIASFSKKVICYFP